MKIYNLISKDGIKIKVVRDDLNNVSMFKAYINNIMMGNAKITFEPSGKCFLNYIEIDVFYKGHGLGRQLLNLIEYVAREKKASEIYGQFEPTNPEESISVRAFYTGVYTTKKSVPNVAKDKFCILRCGQCSYMIFKTLNKDNVCKPSFSHKKPMNVLFN